MGWKGVGGVVPGRAQDSQSGPLLDTPNEGEAGIGRRPPAAQGRWLGTGLRRLSHAPPFSGSRRLVVRFGSYALHRPPPQEEGGKHQGPEARPKVKARWGHPQRPPCSWNGQPAPAAFPEMVVGGRGGRLGPHPLGPHESSSPPFPGFREARVPQVRISISAPRLPGLEWLPSPAPGTSKAGSPVCYMVQKKSPALARVSEGGGGPAPQVSDVPRAGVGT